MFDSILKSTNEILTVKFFDNAKIIDLERYTFLYEHETHSETDLGKEKK